MYKSKEHGFDVCSVDPIRIWKYIKRVINHIYNDEKKKWT